MRVTIISVHTFIQLFLIFFFRIQCAFIKLLITLHIFEISTFMVFPSFSKLHFLTSVCLYLSAYVCVRYAFPNDWINLHKISHSDSGQLQKCFRQVKSFEAQGHTEKERFKFPILRSRAPLRPIIVLHVFAAVRITLRLFVYSNTIFCLVIKGNTHICLKEIICLSMFIHFN